MEFKLRGWTEGDVDHPAGRHQAQFTLAFGIQLTRMAYLAPPLVRAFHRMAFDLSQPPRARTLCMCAVTHVSRPVDNSDAPPPETHTLDDLFVTWSVLGQLLDLLGPASVETHWRSHTPFVEVLALLEALPQLEGALPAATRQQVARFLQFARA